MRLTSLIALLALMVFPVFEAMAQTPAAKADQASIARWIRDLADGDFEAREKASNSLWKAGNAAEKALQEAAKSDDLEVKKRAQEILQKFAMGQLPDTPLVVLDLLGEFQAAVGDQPRRQAVLRKLLVEGKAGMAAVLLMARNEPEITRMALMDLLAQALPAAMGRLEATGQKESLDELMALIGPHGSIGAAHLTAWAAATDTLPGWLATAEKGDGRFATWPAVRRQQALMLLRRASGNLPGAIEVARKINAPNTSDVEALQIEQGAWADLAKVGPSDMNDPTHRAGLKVTFLRLAGKTKEFNESLDLLRELAGRDHDDGERLPYSAKAMLLNDQTEEGLKTLMATNHRSLAFEILAAQMRYKEAFALADAARKGMDRDLPELELVEARLRWLLGEKKRAAEIFDRQAGNLVPGQEPPLFFEVLLENEIMAGRRGEACAHAARPFPTGELGDWKGRVFAKLYPEKTGDADAWWEHLANRAIPGGLVARLKLIGSILNATVTKPEARDLLAGVESRADMPEDLRLAAADLARRTGLAAEEERLLAKGKRAMSRIGLGDALARRDDWAGALRAYDAAETLEPGDPLVQILRAVALDHLGRKAEAQSARSLARRIPLGFEGVRSRLVQELMRRGLVELAGDHSKLLLACTKPGSYEAGNAQRFIAQDMARRDRFLEAAAGQQKALFRIMGRDVSFIYPTAYVSVPALMHRLQARGLLAAGKVDEALSEMKTCQKLMPRDVELPILVYDALVRINRKPDADALYGSTLTAHEELIRDYPECAWARNGAAWMMACCRRDLDRAVVHARKAIEINPESPGYRDTLAEALFQKGEKAAALEEIRKAVAMDPRRVYYRKQLARIEAGQPASQRPDENDDE